MIIKTVARWSCISWLLVLPSLAAAQGSPNGSLNGTVQDTTGAVLPGASVIIKNTNTGQIRTVETNQVGRWTAPALPVGTYQISFEISGFKTIVKDGIAVEASVPRTVDTRLEIGAGKSEEVTVVADALLATPETAATFRQITSQELLQVPTSTRSFTHLLSAEAASARICRRYSRTAPAIFRRPSTARGRRARAFPSTESTPRTSRPTKGR